MPETWPGDLGVERGDWTVSGLPPVTDAETRLRAGRRFVRIVRQAVDADIQGLERRGELERWHESLVEFPLLTWAAMLGWCFSTAESFLSNCAGAVASIGNRPTPAPPAGPKLEGWLKRITELGVPMRPPADLMPRLVGLRRLRNALTHEMGLSETEVAPELVELLDRDPYDRLVPSDRLVLTAIEAIETLVLTIDRGLVEFGERLAR